MNAAAAPLCEMRDVSVRYGAFVANRGVSLQVAPGEIVALVGENGAGKSTLLHALYGMVRVSGGQVYYHGQPVHPSPERAIAAGIGLVHQHFMLVPPLTVAENVVLGSEPRRALRLLSRRRAEQETAALGERYGLHVDPARTVADLTVGEAQRVEILKTLYRGARLLVLDEPTAVLTPGEVERLLGVLRHLLDPGDAPERRRGMLLVTHKLDEVMAIADRVVVMRRGEVVATLLRGECTPQAIARAMVGRELVPVTRQRASASGTRQGALSVSDLVVDRDGVRRVHGVSLSVRAGEILGIAGVEGNGQTELCAALFGLLPVLSGSVRLGGEEITFADVATRRHKGLALVPEDRHRHGLVLDFSLAENLLLGHLSEYTFGWEGWLIDQGKLGSRAQALLREYEVQPALLDAPARSLSGGNQQKVVIARELSGGDRPRVLIAAQPTRGVDIGAIESIHRRLLDARDQGCAILLLSAELDELRALCDRVVVMYRGRVVADLENPVDPPLSRMHLGELMTGAQQGPAGEAP